MICFILLAEVFIGKRYRALTFWLTQCTLIAAFILTMMQFGEYPVPVVTLSGHYIIDKLAVLSKLFIYLFSFFAFAYAQKYINERRIASSEYYLLGLFAVLGMSVMVSANSFLTIYLGLELLSLALYVMVAMHKTSHFAVEAAMKYFVLCALASGMLLYGISILYGLTGQIQLGAVADAIQNKPDVVTM